MRRIYIDENLSPQLVRPLAAVYRRDVQFRSWQDESQSGVEDEDLIPYLGTCGYGLIVTKDKAQVDKKPSERNALIAAKLSWLGVPDFPLSGAVLIAEQLAVVLPAVGSILTDWPQVPTLYRLAPRGPTFETIEPL